MSEFALSKKIIVIALGVLFSAFLSYIFFSDAQLQKGFFILFVCAGLWMTEIIPLAVTALLVPVISYFLKVLDAGASMAPFSSTIIYLFMGGFTLAALLQ